MSTAAIHYSATSPRIGPRALTGLARLMWKEYRSLRWFWLAIIGLVILMDWVVTRFGAPWSDTASMIYNFALGAPVMFAIGAAGASFAAEKEEGTYEFLRASPATSLQILFSKWLVIALATIGMAAVLWPMSNWFLGGLRGSSPIVLNDSLTFWSLAALEVIAWGTLFSLLIARPLFAVTMGMLASAAGAHVLSWTAMENYRNVFEPQAYVHAAGLRAVVAALLLIIDVYLASRWLNRYVQKTRVEFTFKIHRRSSAAGALSAQTSSVFEKQIILAEAMLHRRSRLVMIGRLLWQHWRQSGWMMIVLPLVGLPVAAFITGVGFDWLMWRTTGAAAGSIGGFFVCVMILASIAGSMVFLSDKERQRFRYFVEHNVPPRYVWLTRHTLWLSATFGISFLVLYVDRFLNFIRISPQKADSGPIVLLGIVTAHAAGQWMSMHVRSGILAGFFGLLLTGTLYGWICLMHWAGVDLTWSALPIPLVLMYATWLCTPDWISENRRWSARIRAAAVMLVPMGALLIAVPTYRVHQIPTKFEFIDPRTTTVTTQPFVVNTYQLFETINQNLKAGQETADLYRQAAAEYVYPLQTLTLGGSLTADQVEWLEANKKNLDFALQASGRPHCYFGDLLKETELPPALMHGSLLSDLIRTSGKQLEADGDLDAALDRYFAALHTTAQLSSVTSWPQTQRSLAADFAAIAAWGANENITGEQIHHAIDRLAALDLDYLHTVDNAKITYFAARHSILAGKGNPFVALSDTAGETATEARKRLEREVIWGTLMPWENHRAVRLLNLLMYWALQRNDVIHATLKQQGQSEAGEPQGVVRLLSHPHYLAPAEIQEVQQSHHLRDTEVIYDTLDEIGTWLEKTLPDLRWVNDLGTYSNRAMTEFEARRRGTIIVLAIEAYRLKHGKLPNTLQYSVGIELKQVPVDPYSGYEFRYFPDGIPQEIVDKIRSSALSTIPPIVQSGPPAIGGSAEQQQQLESAESQPQVSPYDHRFRQAGIWCTGPDLKAESHSGYYFSSRLRVNEYEYSTRADGPGDTEQWQSTDVWWPSGFWFPIPEGPTQ